MTDPTNLQILTDSFSIAELSRVDETDPWEAPNFSYMDEDNAQGIPGTHDPVSYAYDALNRLVVIDFGENALQPGEYTSVLAMTADTSPEDNLDAVGFDNYALTGTIEGGPYYIPHYILAPTTEGVGIVPCCLGGECGALLVDDCIAQDGKLVSECLGDKHGDGSDDACVPPIPSVSQWSAVVMVLLVLTAATIVIRKRRAMAAS